ncbi:splicing factor 3b subunit 1 [Quercus suber]|uniref:Splicing factor 3b subunit 1 n=1 Tax=Quercus suber TaxID=58331 RepID=A0AAW0LGD5_QUESU
MGEESQTANEMCLDIVFDMGSMAHDDAGPSHTFAHGDTSRSPSTSSTTFSLPTTYTSPPLTTRTAPADVCGRDKMRFMPTLGYPPTHQRLHTLRIVHEGRHGHGHILLTGGLDMVLQGVTSQGSSEKKKTRMIFYGQLVWVEPKMVPSKWHGSPKNNILNSTVVDLNSELVCVHDSARPLVSSGDTEKDSTSIAYWQFLLCLHCVHIKINFSWRLDSAIAYAAHFGGPGEERHLLVKVIDRVLYKLGELVRPYAHKILVVIEPLLIDDDYYACVEGRD